MARLASKRLYIIPQQIHFLKFLLEAYDGLAILSTVDRSKGLVELRFALEQAAELDALLATLHTRLLPNNE
jgi:hypothetical protein